MLGRTVEPTEVFVRLTVLEGSPPRARIELDFEGQREIREVEGPDCNALVDAAALMIAITLDPLHVPPPEPVPPSESMPQPPEPELPEPERPPEPELEFDAEPPTRVDAPVVSETSPTPTAPPVRMWLGLVAGGELGAIPRGTGGIRPSIHVTRGRFEAQVTGDYWIRRRTRAQPTGEGVAVELGVAALRGCGRIRRRRLTIPLCGGVEAGAMRGAGFGLRNVRSDIQPWVAGLASAGGRFRVSPRISLSVLAELFVSVVRPRFDAQAGDELLVLHEPSPVGGRLLLGVVFGPFFGDENTAAVGVSPSR